MADTFLNVAERGTVQAGNNPIQNVAQVDNQIAQQQPITPNANATQGIQPVTQNTQGISPITIPIQIQPQIAQTNQQPATMQKQDMQALSMQSQTSNNAPSPQQYQGTQNTNVVDFNQIYSNYQSAFGTNPSAGNNMSSGIKKTSINTTIVTPTNTNLNTIDGQYQSAYADSINSLISQMLTQLNNGFEYDPNSDSALKVATEYAANSTLQSLAGSGVLNSTATSERVARIVSELIPTYEEKAHDRYIEYLNQLANTAQVVMDYDSQQFEYWKDAKDREFENKKFEYQKKQDELENAWKRVDELGYVDNNASAILGVKVGTLSGEARLVKEQQEFELQKMREQAEIEYKNNVALYKLKNELDLQSSKILAEYESNLQVERNKQMTQNEYELQKQYGSSSSSSNSSTNDKNYEKYDEIIKNRYAEYDDYSKQYIVPDEQTYNELGNYLDSLNANGIITDEEFLRLSAKYSKYSNQVLNTSTTANNTTTTGLNDNNVSTWIKALDGNNKALKELGVNIWGQTKSNVNNKDVKKAVNTALSKIKSGEYKFTSNQQLMNDLKNGTFGNLGWGL